MSTYDFDFDDFDPARNCDCDWDWDWDCALEEDEDRYIRCPVCDCDFVGTPDEVLWHLHEVHGYNLFDAERFLEELV